MRTLNSLKHIHDDLYVRRVFLATVDVHARVCKRIRYKATSERVSAATLNPIRTPCDVEFHVFHNATHTYRRTRATATHTHTYERYETYAIGFFSYHKRSNENFRYALPYICSATNSGSDSVKDSLAHVVQQLLTINDWPNRRRWSLVRWRQRLRRHYPQQQQYIYSNWNITSMTIQSYNICLFFISVDIKLRMHVRPLNCTTRKKT